MKEPRLMTDMQLRNAIALELHAKHEADDRGRQALARGRLVRLRVELSARGAAALGSQALEAA